MMEVLLVISCLALFACPLVAICRVIYLVWQARRKRKSFVWPLADDAATAGNDLSSSTPTPRSERNALRTLVVLGSGGHTSEMIQLIRNLPPERYHPLEFVKASTDTTSVGRLQAARLIVSASPITSKTVLPPAVHEIPRAREVGQSYISSVYSTIHAFLYAMRLIAGLRPDVLLCNGPGTCLPLCVAAFIGRVMGWTCTRIVFVESYCRVHTMSLTGRLLYAWVDLCAVHWATLQTRYPLTSCTSTMMARRSPVKKEQ